MSPRVTPIQATVCITFHLPLIRFLISWRTKKIVRTTSATSYHSVKQILTQQGHFPAEQHSAEIRRLKFQRCYGDHCWMRSVVRLPMLQVSQPVNHTLSARLCSAIIIMSCHKFLYCIGARVKQNSFNELKFSVSHFRLLFLSHLAIRNCISAPLPCAAKASIHWGRPGNNLGSWALQRLDPKIFSTIWYSSK